MFYFWQMLGPVYPEAQERKTEELETGLRGRTFA